MNKLGQRQYLSLAFTYKKLLFSRSKQLSFYAFETYISEVQFIGNFYAGDDYPDYYRYRNGLAININVIDNS